MNFKFYVIALSIFATTLLSCSKKDSGSSTPVPIANFTYTGNGLAPSTVTFNSTSTDASNFNWDFGDNSTGSGSSTTHTYVNGGVYTVKLTATGSGGSNSITKTVNISAPTSARITGIKIVQIPFTDPATGGGWDNNSGPDIFYTITDANDLILVNSATYLPNATAANLPITFTLTPPFQINNFSTAYKLKLWDYDGNDVPSNPDDFIGGYSFNLSGAAQGGYPTVYTLFATGSNIKIELLLQWQ